MDLCLSTAKSCLLLVAVFTVAQALESSFERTPLPQLRRIDSISQRSSRYGSRGSGFGSRGSGFGGRSEFHDRGHSFGGQRGSYFRDSFDDVGGLQYSMRPGRHHFGSRGHLLGGAYNQPMSRYQDCFRSTSLGYATRRCRFPMGSAGRHNLGGDMFGNGNLGYY